MQICEFDYSLPEGLIAHYPTENRSASRLMQIEANSSQISHHQFTDLTGLLEPGDLLVFNNTRVIPARLFGRKESGGKVEILLERLLGEGKALAQIRASKAPKAGTVITLNGDDFVTVTGRKDDFYEISFSRDDCIALLKEHGHIPLPPYITREDEAWLIRSAIKLFMPTVMAQ